MADASFDAVILGGGTKSVVTALYLAKYAGMSVGVFDERRELCSGMTSELGVVPGFVADYHGTAIDANWYYATVREDFPDFEEKGGKTLQAPAAYGVVVQEDQSSFVVHNYESDPTQEKTAKGLAKFASERDAETYLKIWELVKPDSDFYLSFLQDIYNPPPPPGEPGPLIRWFANYFAQPDCLIDPSWVNLPAYHAYQRLWERPALAMHFMRQTIVFGRLLTLTPGIFMFGLVSAGPFAGCIKGGTHSVAHAYQRILQENGGKWYLQKKVDKIIIENGAAKGIQLADGTQVEAKKLIVAGVSPRQLFVEMIGKEHAGDKIIKKVESLVGNVKGLIWWTWFMHELPNYKAAAEFNPAINEADLLAMICDDPRGFYEAECYRDMGKIPPISGRMLAFQHTTVDKTRAPDGKHAVLIDADIPTATHFTEREWLNFKKDYAQVMLDEWQKYAPNMTWDNIIGFDPQTPYDVARRGLNFWPDGNAGIIDVYPGQLDEVAPIIEMAQYRLPIKNLYATGNWRPPGGVNCCQGYACYKVIAEDYGLPKPWEEKGRPY